MTSVAVYSYTHSVTYVADNILKSFKDIIRLSGLDPTKLVEDWNSRLRRGAAMAAECGFATRACCVQSTAARKACVA